jgi:hypothetical protein
MQNIEKSDAQLLRALNPCAMRTIKVVLSVLVLILPLLLPARTAAATEISGKVINKTIGRPAAGVEVVLMDVSADMKEAGRTRTDNLGNFHFRTMREGIPWLIAVTHTGVRYEAAFPAEEQSVKIEVFDKTGSTADIKSGIQVLQLENDAGYLRATEMFTLVNATSPPRTVQKEELFSIPLPAGAALLSSVAEAPGESVVRSIAVAPPNENRCYFNFPLRPGTTKIQLQYQLPYSGSFTLAPSIPFPADMFGLVIPASMQFQPSELGAYTRQPDEKGGVVELIRNARDGSGPSFTVSGGGATRTDGADNIAMPQYRAPSQQEPLITARAEASQTETISKSEYWVWSVLLAVIVIACSTAFVYWLRTRRRVVTGSGDAPMTDELRERLFTLELDRLQNRISKSQYAMARSLLEEKLAAKLASTTTS